MTLVLTIEAACSGAARARVRAPFAVTAPSEAVSAPARRNV